MINLEIDELLLYFGDDYVINDKIKLHQPLIGEIISCEKEYFSMIHTLTAIPSDMKYPLWNMGIDWCQIDDFELFLMLARTLTSEQTKIILGDLDFSKMRVYSNKQNGEIVLADIENDVIIDKLIYMRMVSYLRKLHNITPKPEKAKGKRAREAMIEEDKKKRELNENKPFRSYLLPLISSVKVKQGYTKDYVRNMGLYEFFDDVSRLQVVDMANHLLNGAYCGMADLSKVDKKQFNWMREL